MYSLLYAQSMLGGVGDLEKEYITVSVLKEFIL